MKQMALIISCEHAVNIVPNTYQELFAPHLELLQTHRALDIGAQTIAFTLNQHFNCDLIQAQTTRLLIDCNRSLHHRNCFSEITTVLSKEEKAHLIQQYYLPFRQQVEDNIKWHIEQEKLVLHLSIHSFTPMLNNQTRNTDIGLLYDPKRTHEKTIAKLWQHQFKALNSNLRVRLNYPYRGVSDGFTTALRKRFNSDEYAGIEVESNQALTSNAESIAKLCHMLPLTLKALMKEFE